MFPVSNQAGSLIAAHHRHPTVHKNEIVGIRGNGLQSLLPIISDLDFTAQIAQHPGRHFLIDTVIFVQADARMLARIMQEIRIRVDWGSEKMP